MTDTANRLASLPDETLWDLHARLDAEGLTGPAAVEAHHLVTTEMLRRNVNHGHEADEWSQAVVLVETAEVDGPDEIDAPEGMEKAWRGTLAEGGTVSVLLTVDGYVLKADSATDGPDVGSVHVDTVMGSGKRKRKGSFKPGPLVDPETPVDDSVDEVGKADGYPVPREVRAAARQAVRWIEEGRAGDGFTAVGRERARQLADGGPVGHDTLVKMRAYFARHVVDKDAEAWGDKSEPTPGMVAWYAWGGDPGRAWVNGILGDVEKAIDPDEESEEEYLATLDEATLAWYGDIGFLIDNGGNPENLIQKAGNPEALRDYWREGGKGKISWGAGGDFTACVAAVSKYMTDEEAKGYCAIRHREVTGMWPGDKRNLHKAVPGPGDVSGVMVFPGGLTYTFTAVEPVLKHPGHADQKVHGGGGGGGSDSVSDAGGGGGTDLPAATKRDLKRTLNRGVQVESYGYAYDAGKAARGKTGTEKTVQARIAERDRALKSMRDARASDPNDIMGGIQSSAAAAASAQGFIDGATGQKPFLARSHTFGEALAGLMFGGMSGATKAAEIDAEAEPVLKHPGHGDQKVHGRKGGGSEVAPKRSTPKGGDGSPVGTTIDSYPESVRREIRRKPESVTFRGEEIRKGRDSAWDHLLPDGQGGYMLTPERAAIHEEIIAKRLKGKPSQDEPVFVMMGGGGGAGKGTLLDSGLLSSVPGKDERVHIDADEIKMEIPDYGRLVSAGRKTEVAGFTHEESSMISKEIQRRAIEQRSHILLDGTGDSSEDSLRGKIAAPRDAGYKVIGEYVTVPTRVAWDRNVERAASGPRGLVPASELVKAHKAVSSIVPRVSGEFDEFRLWDSTDGRGKQVVIASTTRGSKLRVRDRNRYQTFLDKAGEPISTDQLIADITPETWTRIRETTT